MPWLDEALIRANPKILLGSPDTTTLAAAVWRLGIVTIHGQPAMAGLSQMDGLLP